MDGSVRRTEVPATEWLGKHFPGWAETIDDFRRAWRGDGDASLGPDASPIRREIVTRLFMAMMPEMRNNLIATGLGVLLMLAAISSVEPSGYLLAWGIWACCSVVSWLFIHAQFMRAPPAGEEFLAWKVSFPGAWPCGCPCRPARSPTWPSACCW